MNINELESNNIEPSVEELDLERIGRSLGTLTGRK